MALPHMVKSEGEIGICPQLEEVVGIVEGAERWKDFISADSHTAREFTYAWNTLTSEARDTWQCLGKEPSGPLAASVLSAGGINLDGSTRKEVQQQREGLRYELLTWALRNHPDIQARPVTMHQNIADDKVAGRWLLAIPGSGLSMSGAVFQEAMSAHLCLPSPAIINGGWEGKPGGRRGERIDKFGDSVMNNQEIYGDSWRRRHDTVKQHVMTEALLSGIHVDCEVYGQFSDLLPATLVQEGGELQWGRARQGVVPDFKLVSNTPQGPVSSLAELKVINCGKTRYPRGVVGKATDRRAALINSEYERKLRVYDEKYYRVEPFVRGKPEPPPGPLLRRYRSFPMKKLVAGSFGDLSSDFHSLLKDFAESRAEISARAKGREGGASAGELGKVMGEVRRAMSVVVVRSQALCLLERLSQLGPGARAAGERRKLVLRLEEERKRQAESYRLAHMNSGLCRLGRAFVP